MKPKKLTIKEKIDTQVINLQEVKEAASKEKKSIKKKRIPIWILSLGAIMVIIGLIIMVITVIEISSKQNVIEVDDADKLVCTINQDTTTGMKTEVKVDLNFKNNKLYKYTKYTSYEAYNEQTMTFFANGYLDIVTQNKTLNQFAGIKAKVTKTENNTIVNNMLEIDFSKFNSNIYEKTIPQGIPEIDNILKIRNKSKSIVKNQYETLNYKCK